MIFGEMVKQTNHAPWGKTHTEDMPRRAGVSPAPPTIFYVVDALWEKPMDWDSMKKLTVCRKRWFPTEHAALGFRNKVRNRFGKDQRQYECKKCRGWHLTSRLLPWQIKNAKAMGYYA